MGVHGLDSRAAAAVNATKRQAGQAAQDAAPFVERMARLGYFARGVVYVTVGWLAILAALGWGGKKTTADGALATIANQPFGKILLVVLVLGLAGYAAWRFVQAAVDPEHHETNAKALAKRVGYAISGVAYSGLAISAVNMLRGVAGPRHGTTQDATARLMEKPFGPWLVGLVGLIVIGVGLNAAYIAVKEKFLQKLKQDEMNLTERQWAMRIGKAGLLAKAAVSGIIGWFLLQAALQSNPDRARGLDGTLHTVAQQPFGKWLLGIVALGLLLYGVYSFFEARYRRIMGS
jgi:Na+/proline symporter